MTKNVHILYNNFIEMNLISLKFELLDKNHFPILFIFEKVQEGLTYFKVVKQYYNKNNMKKIEDVVYSGTDINKLIKNIEVL